MKIRAGFTARTGCSLMATPKIPDKLYFKIGEVAKITRVKPYVLRYWENEFKILVPFKTKGNQRVYKRKDIELIFYIKKLIDKEKLTLEGAKKKVKDFAREKKNQARVKQLDIPFNDKKYQNALKGIRKDLTSLRTILSRKS